LCLGAIVLPRMEGAEVSRTNDLLEAR